MGVDLNFDEITEKKESLDARRPLSTKLLHHLGDWFRTELSRTIDTTSKDSTVSYDSTAPYDETRLALELGVTIRGQSFKDHLEATSTDYKEALAWMKKQLHCKPSSLREKDILQLHFLVLKEIRPKDAGKYRDVGVEIYGLPKEFPHEVEVPEFMAEFFDWLSKDHDLHPVELAARAHYKLVTIHPFVDGNGRTSRLLMNLILMMSGYPPAIIYEHDRGSYMAALGKAQLGGSLDDFIAVVAEAVERSLDTYLGMAHDTEWVDS